MLTSDQSHTHSSAGNHSAVSFFYLHHPIFGFWLIDYGAIDHRCSSLQYFSSFYSIKFVRVSLANGTSIIVNYAGNVHFFFTLKLMFFIFIFISSCFLIFIDALL